MVIKSMSDRVFSEGRSDVGLVRQNNEDSWNYLPDELFYVLADGMGGHRAGEVAAKKATDLLCTLFKKRYEDSDKSLEKTKEIIWDCIQEVSNSIFKMGSSNEELHGMGTTLCCMLIHPTGLVYAHVGDSRIYLIHKNKINVLTQDHSLLRELRDLGQIDDPASDEYRYKSILTRAVGTESYVEPTINTVQVQEGDIIMMCSDGLTDMLTDQEIHKIIKTTPANDAVKALIKAAKSAGGVDNITVVLVKIEEKDEQQDIPRS